MKVFAKTIFTLLLMASWVFYLSSYYEKIKFQNQIESLNVTMPGSFSYLLDVEKLKKVDLREINRYINFYQKIVDYFPEQADAHSMLGFCYYYRGDGAKALSAYKKAINNHPDYFWFYYNLGVIYFQKSDYVQAVPFLEKAIKTNPDENLRYTLSSNVVYRGVLDEIPQPDQELKRRLVSGYQQAYFLLALSGYRLGDYAAMLNYAESAILSKIGEPATFFYLSGLAAYKLGDHQKAMYYFEKCITIDPENVYALRLLKLAKQNGSNSLNLDDIADIAQFQIQGFYPLLF